ncbi:Lactonohydrolase oryL [Fulvia fulva]|uniref:Lactonohydrolase oryL n=1 Tax=Passalora fulva TaxID=5499 RepID=A0A9Q8P4U4_PASFU|nr:Lactonohydrolase oryL [Fulvia fulva]KAK4631924.1 Lactonohydrolase oryL [Fulvia fulva]KAK4633554.1 Lactonohydrolase oryL [Fulvia fulva]UJO13333.1 Lactonohydrolase oryL [Fulvia fulva]WPV11099.1 Lactonohydrolase oryL [Fulvia fulva]WPV26746.1 Lactonohydrolase oryL [Fulvia fulva]
MVRYMLGSSLGCWEAVRVIYLTALAALLFTSKVKSQAAQPCAGYEDDTNIVCINKYASVLPLPFDRPSFTTGADPAEDNFINTEVPADPSFSLIKNASFLVYNDIGLSLLGPKPIIEKMFTTRNDSIHEASVYVPGLNVIIFSQPHQGVYQQQLINLNHTPPPTIETYTTTPPIYAVNGAKLHQNHIYCASEASYPFPSPTPPATLPSKPQASTVSTPPQPRQKPS